MPEPDREENPPSPDDRVQTVKRVSGQYVFIPGGKKKK